MAASQAGEIVISGVVQNGGRALPWVRTVARVDGRLLRVDVAVGGGASRAVLSFVRPAK